MMMLSKTTKIVCAMLICLSANNSYALELMDNDAMSNSVAQDGITITLQNFNPNTRLNWIDKDGLADQDLRDAYNLIEPASAGAVRFGDGTAAGNFRLQTSDHIVIHLDSDAGNNAPFVNLNIKLPQKLTINTGDVYVSTYDKTDGSYANDQKIMRDMTVEIGDGSGQGINLNVQLGHAPQGNFLAAYGTIAGGIKVSNIGVVTGTDIMNNEFGLGISQMSVHDTNSMNLTFNGASVGVTERGLILSPSADKKINVLMQDVKFGNLDSSGQSIGDIALSNLAIGNNKIIIMGH